MKGFFRGRNLDNEARRFLSLTRYGQSRAIAEGVPVELWINPRQARYGLEALSGYTETQTNPLVYDLDQTVQIAFSAPSSVLTRSNYWTQTPGAGRRGDARSGFSRTALSATPARRTFFCSSRTRASRFGSRKRRRI